MNPTAALIFICVTHPLSVFTVLEAVDISAFETSYLLFMMVFMFRISFQEYGHLHIFLQRVVKCNAILCNII